ncbi:unnamed protein product [Calypogeia fissa]
MSSRKCCRYCLEADPAVVRSWGNDCHTLEISGCSTCHKRHEKEVTALKAEVRSLQAARSKVDHKTELPSIEAENQAEGSPTKKPTYEELQWEVDWLNKKVEFLKLQEGDRYRLPCNLWLTNEELYYYPLIARSRVIQKLLLAAEEPTAECLKAMKVKPLCDISEIVFDEILSFCHTGEFDFWYVARPCEVLRAANLLQIGFLEELCRAELCRELCPEVWQEMLKLVQQFEASKLLEKVKVLNKQFGMMLTED